MLLHTLALALLVPPAPRHATPAQAVGWAAQPHLASSASGAPRAFVAMAARGSEAEREREREIARNAGRAAVAEASSREASAQTTQAERGKEYALRVESKPLGLVLATNPTGRGCFVSEVLPDGSVANARPGQLKMAPGDYLTAVQSRGRTYSVVWQPLDEVLELIGDTELPLTLRIMRGGPEPWSLEKDGSGLSVEQMMEESRRQYGRLLDTEQEDALRGAFAAIKEDEQRAASERASAGGYESDTLKGVSTFAYELRSFAQGARDALDQIAQSVYNRALLDSRIAVQTAEYLLRRAIFDSGRILSAASTAVAALSPAASSSTMSGGAAPFERMLGRISTTRSLGAAPTAADAADAATEEERQAAQDKAAAERQAMMREEAGSLLREAVSAIEIWARNAAKNESAPNAAPAAEEEIDWELLTQRASLLGGELGVSVRAGLETAQADFAAFQSLQQSGQLPTLIEQLAEPAVLEGDQGGARTGASTTITRGDGRLGAFRDQAKPNEQRRDRLKRRQSDLEAKQLKLGLAIGQRASKDSADAFVYGVLPSAKAVGRMAARRVAESVADSVDMAQGKPGAKRAAPGVGDAVGLVGELASEIAQQYKEDLKRGAEMGPLADLVDAVSAPTQKLKNDLKGVAEALPGSIKELLQAPTDLLPGSTSGTTRPFVDDGARVVGSPVTSPLRDYDEEPFVEATLVGEAVEVVEVESLAVQTNMLEVEVETVDSVAPGVEVMASAVPANDAPGATVVYAAAVSETGMDVDIEADFDFEAEAVDVSVTSVEADGGQSARERAALLLDFLLLNGESALGTLGERAANWLTPEKARDWKKLGAFRDQASPADQKAARAKEKLLDDFADSVMRR